MTAPTSQKRRRKAKASLEDDTPRAFKQLLNYALKGRKVPSGLDDNLEPPSKKRKRTTTATSTSQSLPANQSSRTINTVPELPKILPHEPLSAFGARVDAALPLAGLTRSKRGKGPELQRGRQTKTERKMQRMQQEWREADRKRKERAEEESDANVMEDDDMGGLAGIFGKSRRTAQAGNNAKTKKKKKKHGNKSNDAEPQQTDLDEGDPWAAVGRKRAELSTNPTSTDKGRGRGQGLVGLHDVVLAPPKLPNMSSRAKLKAGVQGSGTETESSHRVQPSVGGLRRQAELSAARREVIEGYRRMMQERRGERE